MGCASLTAPYKGGLSEPFHHLPHMSPFFFQQTGDPATSRRMTWQALADLRHQQAASMADFDDFWLFAVLAVALVFLVPLTKRSVAEKGAHVGAE